MGDRQNCREITRTRQRIDLPALRIKDRMEAGDQAGQGNETQYHHAAIAVDRLETIKQRLERGAEMESANARQGWVEQHDHEGRDHQRHHAEYDALWHVSFGID
ncbi:hypothetical protein D3C78_1130200 [compost metagenome]